MVRFSNPEDIGYRRIQRELLRWTDATQLVAGPAGVVGKFERKLSDFVGCQDAF